MSKLHLLSIVFIVIAVISCISLGMEAFGDMNPDTIIILAIVFGVGLIGSCICTFARAIIEIKKK